MALQRVVPSPAATKRDIDALQEKLDLIFFAQAEILVRMKQEPEESAHYPLYQKEALAVSVGMEQEAIKEARQVLLQQLAANAEPEQPKARRRPAAPETIQ